MRLLFDTAHPAHVHLFRNLIARVRREGGEALVAARDKDVAVPLLRAYDIPHVLLSRAGRPGPARNAAELLARTWKLLLLARRFRPDALVGPSASIGLVGRLIGRPSFVFCEDDAAIVPRFARIAYPLARYVVTPACLAFENYGARHLTYAGYHELAYLHPAHFTPEPRVPAALGLSPDAPYFLVRLVALTGHHDTGAHGITHEMAGRLVELLASRGRVLISSESPLEPALERHRFTAPPESLHHVLAFAALYVGDSQTLSIEAGVLGVPNLRCNSFVDRIACLKELDHTWGLTLGIRPEESHRVLATASVWLADLPGVRRELAERRRRMLAASVDVADWQWRTLRELAVPS
jgi:predicted glycosyltransferase